MYTHEFLCESVRVSLADSGSRLEIKTLCGTWLMIGLKLKQKSGEHTEKNRERRRETWNGKSRSKRNVLSEKERSERLPPLQSYSLCLGCFLSECHADLSHWLTSVSSLLKCESN